MGSNDDNVSHTDWDSVGVQSDAVVRELDARSERSQAADNPPLDASRSRFREAMPPSVGAEECQRRMTG